MEQHGKDLAGTHRLSAGSAPDRLLGRLAGNEGILRDTCCLLSDAVKANRRITPAGEWLLDNFYLIEEQIRTARRHLPKRYGSELPRLSHGPAAGYPRAYDIALEAISHGDGRVDPESLERYVAAYQKIVPLKLGELWAIPIMLRLALIENLRRVAARIAASAVNRDLADDWADRMMEVAETDPKSLILEIADMARSTPPMDSAFVAELARRLQGQSPALALPLTWIEQRLAEEGATIEQMVQVETQTQAAGQVSISNSIGSLRSLGAMDWREFVETMSVVEQKLREDPVGIYATMDFATRDSYRHAVEKIAKMSRLSEGDVARKAIQLAHEGAAAALSAGIAAGATRAAHIGYYLTAEGLPQLEAAAQVRWSAIESACKASRRYPLVLYLGTIALLTAIFTWGLLARAHAGGLHGWLLVAGGLLAALCTSQLAVALVNWFATMAATPHALPRLDFSSGIPPHCRTLVVVPTMLTHAAGIEDLIEALEVRFLANRDRRLHFGLLTDFTDAPEQTLPADATLLALADARIEELNQKYRDVQDTADGDPFFLFHRARRWNAQERTWMGYERKRGKLADLNLLLRGGPDRFARMTGTAHVLPSVKYVITLDTDTQLPRDSARQFVGTMAHPLNHPRFDDTPAGAQGQRVAGGYGILQPRVAVSLPGTNRSRYARLFGAEPGIDPYTRAVSDVYQDVFSEGSFIGKGIYDVDAFEAALKDRFPENRILSHDLLEGCYARAALLSDVELYEDYPARYSADVARRHRWIRGDWQIASWLLTRVPGTSDGQRNPLSGLAHWKIFDNLRRSVVPAGLTLLLLLGWTLSPQPWLWNLVVLGIMLIPSVSASILELFRKPDEVLPGQHINATMQAATRHLAQAAMTLACLPYEAWFSLDAIARTNWRIFVSRKKLLEWSPSQESNREFERYDRTSLSAAYGTMWIAPLLALATALWLFSARPGALAVAAPILFLWLVAPAVAWWISRPLPRREAKLSSEQTVFLQKLARQTWAFFETFVGPEDHWLPPDNFQEHPVPVVAHRTSPTNMGLALLANLSAYDFGYIQSRELVERTTQTLATMQALERHRGHFYNWYDTQSLQPLPPLYISSVDSGNLAAHLLTLRPGLLAVPDQPIVGIKLFEGLGDTVRVFAEAAAKLPPAASARLTQLQKDIESAYDSRPATVTAARNWLTRLANAAAEVTRSFESDDQTAIAAADAKWWAHALMRQCRGALDELNALTPWQELPAAPGKLKGALDAAVIPTLRELANWAVTWLPAIEQRAGPEPTHEEREWLSGLRRHVTEASGLAQARIAALENLAQQAGELAHMDYSFLYNEARHLLAIGYNVAEHRQDTSYYDLLASEARLTTFVAIAQGQLPQESWFALGRLLTNTGGAPVLLSWSGSMFEYLMPLLVMPTYENTLLDQTYAAAVSRQIAYGKQRDVAWGMSECGYNAVDAALNYQYRAFGVPGTGLKRGLAEDLVIAPYASALALMVAPEAACANLQRLAGEGLAGKFGLYEAVDYTPLRLPRGQTSAVVRSFMAHHLGMSLLALAYQLLDRPMQKRFEADPQFQATTLLLQERVPRSAAFHPHTAEFSAIRATESGPEMPVRVIASPNTPVPEVHLLSNGRYHVMVTNAGGGYSRWKDLAVTRWREDSTCDNWGTFCYIRDAASGIFWSTAHQPTLKRADNYEAIFSEGRAEFRRRDLDYDTHTEIVVSPEDDIELRRVHIVNRARTRRTIDLTSYAEVVIAAAAADAIHPAFSNLFVQTEIVAEHKAILCTRRPRSLAEHAPWMFHLMAAHGAGVEEISYETDRVRFVGRGRTVAAPQAMSDAGALSGSAGSVLDPVVAIRYRITLEPEQMAVIDMVTGIGETRDGALSLIGKYSDRRLANRVFELASTHGWVTLRQINASEADAQLYGRLASSVIYANAALRAENDVLIKNRRGQSGLWGYAISGDLPIVLLQIGDLEHIDLVRQVVQAHAYWRLKGLVVDLVIWNEDHAGYRQVLQEQIMGLIAAGVEAHVMDRPGGIFVRRAEQISDEDRILVEAVARIILSDRRGALADQIVRRGLLEGRAPHMNMPRFAPTRAHRAELPKPDVTARADLLFNNGLGGFTPDGREYVITTSHGHVTPAPWVNVLANPQFGTVISDSGAAYTWSENAHEFRLTPWGNDAVSEASGEAFYLRDEESGHFWSPAPLPARGAAPYVTRHGFGYSVFEYTEGGISSSLRVYVDLEAAVKFSVLKVRNDSGRLRRLSATGYVEWVLGDLRPKSAMHVVTEIDGASGALYARNAYNTEFAGRTAFFDNDDASRTYTGDRAEFFGRNGTLKNPAAMSRSRLSNKLGAALDPCAAIQVSFELADGQERELVFRLGAARNADDARKLVHRFRGSAAARGAFDKVRQYWERTLGAVQVETPDPSLNVLTNGWLVYQTLASRLWARSGYYQSGGAFGFRDQLQDVMALIYAEPALAREHLLRCAAHQFREGDVQHWWHPTSDRGVRTRCSDDYLWLPLAMCRYVLATGDHGVLDEPVRFLEGRKLNVDEESYYDLPGHAGESASLYEHGMRAILHGLSFGERGLPLMGSGDWNDGMNLVGIHGKGESVWLAFFLYDVLMRFTALARVRGDMPFAERCQLEAAQLRQNIERTGWDGEWYRRAYFDDGTPLGSAENTECQIDAIAQSWAVLSGAGDPRRARTAMAAVDRRLVRRNDGLIQLLDPPFDKSDLNPGYIKGYVPGVRENGGQYTHSAIWTVMAFAALGDSRRAWELFTLINPINHASSAEKIATYKVEPYVAAADVYAVAPHTGRGGWTWYTGSAGWLYRLILESLLGLKLEVDKLRITPCLPAEWENCKIHYRYCETLYHITVIQLAGADPAAGVTVDGVDQRDDFIALVDDRQEHAVEVKVRRA
ncbi:MAG: cyclic beta 1-2 glucan synthetase [Betaproteobacteria bacterium]|nr:cyclic beta 1-2 glucan synthetase [Betaproteobacteria bacterium]